MARDRVMTAVMSFFALFFRGKYWVMTDVMSFVAC
jgi:hypothetical protein